LAANAEAINNNNNNNNNVIMSSSSSSKTELSSLQQKLDAATALVAQLQREKLALSQQLASSNGSSSNNSTEAKGINSSHDAENKAGGNGNGNGNSCGIPVKSSKDEFKTELALLNARALSVVVIGASGHLAKTKTYPALFALHCKGLLPAAARITGYARSEFKQLSAFHAQISAHFKRDGAAHDANVKSFLQRCDYHRGASYGSVLDFGALNTRLAELEAKTAKGTTATTGKDGGGGGGANRLFYLAIPPSAFADSAKAIKQECMSKSGWNRVVVEKPFGRDSASSAALSKTLLSHFKESELYRIDHYLGKEIVQNLMTMRHSNTVLEPLWNRNYVASVQITFKEDIGVQGTF
jgi:glucose-6-phosphate 1-dehydrogenase